MFGSWPTTRSSISSGSISSSSSGSSSTASGRRSTMPSSLHIISTSTPHRSASVLLQRHGPRGVHLGAERREDADPPVADLVAEALDHDRAVVGDDAGGLGLLVEVRQRGCARRSSSRPWLLAQRARRRPACAAARSSRTNCPMRPAELERAAGAVAVPERHLAGLARGRRDDDPVEGDVLDAPRGRAEQERLAGTGLVDHLLVELADPGAVGQEHAEQAAVGDGAAAGDGEALGAGAAPTTPPPARRGAVPHDAGAQLAELVGRVAAGEQVEARRGSTSSESVGEVGAAPHDRGPGRRPATRRARTWRRSAGRARRAGCGGSGCAR